MSLLNTALATFSAEVHPSRPHRPEVFWGGMGRRAPAGGDANTIEDFLGWLPLQIDRYDNRQMMRILSEAAAQLRRQGYSDEAIAELIEGAV